MWGVSPSCTFPRGAGTSSVRKALQNPEPVPYSRFQSWPAPVFGPFREIADRILAADDLAPRKAPQGESTYLQKLTAVDWTRATNHFHEIHLLSPMRHNAIRPGRRAERTRGGSFFG